MEEMQVSAFYESKVGIIEVKGKEGLIEGINFVEDIPQTVPVNLPDYLQECVAQLDEYFNHSRKEFTVKFKLNGTEFQNRVWSQLLNIPFGKTMSYLELAEKLGDPLVIRAAASANGKNKLAIIVPCHRVIGSNRELIGYAGGLWRKKILLNHEQGVEELSLF